MQPNNSCIFTLILLSLLHAPIAQNCGFTVDLIHRNSKKSPFIRKETPLQHFKNGFPRAVSRIRRLLGGMVHVSEVQREADNNGEHIMRFSIGTPPQKFQGIIDTGSDLFWAQCTPCVQCFDQNNPLYNSKASSSFKVIPFNSPDCKLLDTVSRSPESICNYTYGYGDGSLTKGVLARETITFSGGTTVENVVFGCGRNNTGMFHPNESGLVGLGARPLSFAYQISASLGNKKFSYCLAPPSDPNSISKMHFGSAADIPAGPDVVTLPLVQKDDTTPYFITVLGMRVGPTGTMVPYITSGPSEKGNMFIDSGVPSALLPADMHKKLVNEIKKSIKVAPYNDPDLKDKLCYKTNSMANGPVIYIYFEGNKKMTVPTANTFIKVKEGVYCLGMDPIEAKIGVYGNYLQSNYRIMFDIEKHIVSFKKADCAKAGS